MGDDVNSPAHYACAEFESIDMIEALGHGKGFVLGCALKYIHRCERKGEEVKDLGKAIWYLQRRLQQIEEESIEKKDVQYHRFVVTSEGNRVGGDSAKEYKHDHYEFDASEVLGHCATCGAGISASDCYLQYHNEVFCSTRCEEAAK